MAVEIPVTGTEYTANAITLHRGTTDDITFVGVYHGVDPNVVPELNDFVETTLVLPTDPLADGNNIDILTLVGARETADVTLEAGDYQRWCRVSTADEDILRKIDVVTILGSTP